MKTSKMLFALPAVALLVATVPTDANARTKDIVKYGAIGLGVAALSNMAQNNYYSQPYYGGYYQQPYYSQPYYGGYYSYPQYNYSYSYSSYPSYGYYGYY